MRTIVVWVTLVHTSKPDMESALEGSWGTKDIATRSSLKSSKVFWRRDRVFYHQQFHQSFNWEGQTILRSVY